MAIHRGTNAFLGKKWLQGIFDPVFVARSRVREKMAIILPTGQWYAPSAVINDAWNCIVLHGIVWYCMALHGIALYCIVLHGIAWYGMVLHGIEWFCMVLQGIA